MKAIYRLLISTVLFILFMGFNCKKASIKIVSPASDLTSIEWSDADKKKEIAVQTPRKTAEASFHYMRLKTKEKPHFHETHDIVALLLKGK